MSGFLETVHTESTSDMNTAEINFSSERSTKNLFSSFSIQKINTLFPRLF